VDAIEGSFVANEERGAAGVVGEFLEYEGDAVLDDGLGELLDDILFAPDKFHLIDARFNCGETAETPAGGGHGVDELGFNVGLGTELIEVGLKERLVIALRFARQNDSLCGQAVAQGVARGFGFPFGRDGALRKGTVDSGSVGLK
jgi:hypothetical protein